MAKHMRFSYRLISLRWQNRMIQALVRVRCPYGLMQRVCALRRMTVYGPIHGANEPLLFSLTFALNSMIYHRVAPPVIDASVFFFIPFAWRKEIRAKNEHRCEWYCIDIGIRLFTSVDGLEIWEKRYF